MAWLFIEERIFMTWQQHNCFMRELKALSKKYRDAETGLEKIKKLLAVQFDPVNPREVIAPGKIHCCTRNGIWEMWKVEMLVSGLNPSQWPRVWFMISGDTITFLTIGTHISNYKDNDMERLALERISDLE
jgi:hypothetical protein